MGLKSNKTLIQLWQFRIFLIAELVQIWQNLFVIKLAPNHVFVSEKNYRQSELLYPMISSHVVYSPKPIAGVGGWNLETPFSLSSSTFFRTWLWIPQLSFRAISRLHSQVPYSSEPNLRCIVISLLLISVNFFPRYDTSTMWSSSSLFCFFSSKPQSNNLSSFYLFDRPSLNIPRKALEQENRKVSKNVSFLSTNITWPKDVTFITIIFPLGTWLPLHQDWKRSSSKRTRKSSTLPLLVPLLNLRQNMQHKLLNDRQSYLWYNNLLMSIQKAKGTNPFSRTECAVILGKPFAVIRLIAFCNCTPANRSLMFTREKSDDCLRIIMRL